MTSTKQNNTVTLIGFLLLTAIGGGIWYTLHSAGINPVGANGNSPTTPPGTITVKPNTMGAYTEADLDKALTYANSNDQAAFNQLITQGRLTSIPTTTTLTVSQCLGVACSKVKVRPAGTTQDLYIISEALNK